MFDNLNYYINLDPRKKKYLKYCKNVEFYKLPYQEMNRITQMISPRAEEKMQKNEDSFVFYDYYTDFNITVTLNYDINRSFNMIKFKENEKYNNYDKRWEHERRSYLGNKENNNESTQYDKRRSTSDDYIDENRRRVRGISRLSENDRSGTFENFTISKENNENNKRSNRLIDNKSKYFDDLNNFDNLEVNKKGNYYNVTLSNENDNNYKEINNIYSYNLSDLFGENIASKIDHDMLDDSAIINLNEYKQNKELENSSFSLNIKDKDYYENQKNSENLDPLFIPSSPDSSTYILYSFILDILTPFLFYLQLLIIVIFKKM